MALRVLDADEVAESAKKKKEQEKPFGPSLLSATASAGVTCCYQCLVQDYCFTVCQALAGLSLQAMVTPLQR